MDITVDHDGSVAIIIAAVVYGYEGYAMLCEYPFRVFKGSESFKRKYPTGLEVPCGKCRLCKAKRVNEWSTRCQHELLYWEDHCAVTFTYDDDHLPVGGSLQPDHFSSLVREIRRTYKCRYLVAGEYGDRTNRPHYHAIMYGVPLMAPIPAKEWWGQYWHHGHVHVAPTDQKLIRYINKYLDGVSYDPQYRQSMVEAGLVLPFKRQSNGIGKRFAYDHLDQMIRQGRNIPRYYLRLFNIRGEDIFDRKKEVRNVHALSGESLTLDDAYKFMSADSYKVLHKALLSQRDNKVNEVAWHEINTKHRSKL